MKSIYVVVCLLGIGFLGLSGSARASLLGVGDNLIYDSDLHAVWYDAPNLLQSTFEALSLVPDQLNASHAMTLIEGRQVSLDWQVATMAQVNSLDWHLAETRNLFTPAYYGEPLHPPSWMETSLHPGPWMEYDIGGRVDEPAWDPDLTDDVNLGCWFQLYISPQEVIENWDEGSMYFPLNSSLQGTWAIATYSPVPEPSTLLLFGFGLAGLFWSRRKAVRTR